MEQPEGKKRKNTAPTLDERFCFLCPAFDDGRIRTQVDPIVTHIIEHHREECTRPGQHAETWLARRMEAGGTRVVRYEKGKQTPIHPHQYRQLEAPVVEFLAPAPVQLPAPLVNNVAGLVPAGSRQNASSLLALSSSALDLSDSDPALSAALPRIARSAMEQVNLLLGAAPVVARPPADEFALSPKAFCKPGTTQHCYLQGVTDQGLQLDAVLDGDKLVILYQLVPVAAPAAAGRMLRVTCTLGLSSRSIVDNVQLQPGEQLRRVTPLNRPHHCGEPVFVRVE